MGENFKRDMENFLTGEFQTGWGNFQTGWGDFSNVGNISKRENFKRDGENFQTWRTFPNGVGKISKREGISKRGEENFQTRCGEFSNVGGNISKRGGANFLTGEFSNVVGNISKRDNFKLSRHFFFSTFSYFSISNFFSNF